MTWLEIENMNVHAFLLARYQRYQNRLRIEITDLPSSYIEEELEKYWDTYVWSIRSNCIRGDPHLTTLKPLLACLYLPTEYQGYLLLQSDYLWTFAGLFVLARVNRSWVFYAHSCKNAMFSWQNLKKQISMLQKSSKNYLIKTASWCW